MREFIEIAGSFEFWVILAGVVSGIVGLSGWIVIPLVAVVLMLRAWPKYAALLPRVWRAGAETEFVKTLALSAFNSGAAATAAFAVGRFLSWVWL